MKRVLVTGGAGFIGSGFVRYAARTCPDWHLVVYDKLTYAGNLDNLREVEPRRYTFIRGDIAEPDTLREAMKGCDAVVNFAAETHVDRSIQHATDFLRTNIEGVYHVVETARALGTARVVLVSTDEVYGSIDEGAFTESSPLNPRNPYSAAKASGELLGRAWFTTYGVPVMITRGCNTYGPYQYPEKVLPLFITNALDNEPLPLYEGGEHNVRDWLYVDDHCSAILTVLERGRPGEIYNISAGQEKQNIELTYKVLELTGRDASLIRRVPDRPGHDRRYAIDSSKLRALGWHPQTTWEEGMAKTVQWYKENQDWWRRIKSGEFREYYRRQYAALFRS